MRNKFLKLLSLVVILATALTATYAISVSGLTPGQIQNEINRLEKESADLEKDIKKLQNDINKQSELKKAVQQKIAVIQKEIDLHNSKIATINSNIEKNNREIKQKEAEIEASKLALKKRLRAIYMSNTGSDLQILLGADDFSDFLQLSQMTASISAQDKSLTEGLIKDIDKLKIKQEENNKLLEELVEVKNTVVSKQNELINESNRIQSIINSIDADQEVLENNNAKLEAQIKNYKNTLSSLAQSSGGGVYTGGKFAWPTTRYKISAGFKSNDSVHNGNHDGIDIIGHYRGEIAGQPVYAIADGTVSIAKGGCSHNQPKNGWTCGCNGNFGNYVKIEHGSTYVSVYGHMSSLAVSWGQRVKKGQVIGYVGSTGWSTGYHLHFGIAYGGRYVNPMNYYS